MSDSISANLENAAKLLTKIKETYSVGSEERELLLLAKNVCFFVFLDRADEFGDFMKALAEGNEE